MENIRNVSKEVKEVLGKPPTWIVRVGTMVVSSCFLLLFSLTALISYHDIVISDVTVTSVNPPVELLARKTGEINEIFISHGQKVKKDEAIAELRNPASFQDIQTLKTLLRQNKSHKSIPLDSLPSLFPNTFRLGNIQDEYINYYQSLLNVILYDSLAPNQKQIDIYSAQLDERTRLLQQQYRKLGQFSEELSLSKNRYDRNLSLFEKGVISKAELEAISKNYLQDKQKMENLRSSISLTKISISDLESSMQRTNLSDLTDSGTINEDVKQKYQKLQNAVQDYEQKFILRSPIEGKVNMMQVWDRYQTVSKDEVLFAVVPNDRKGSIGHLRMPIQNSGKVKTGQIVIIKLSNYPFQQYGTLKGRVKSISSVPNKKDLTYSVFIEIPKLITSYGQNIPLDRELMGRAEIITEKLTLMQRMLYGFRKLMAFDRSDTQ